MLLDALYVGTSTINGIYSTTYTHTVHTHKNTFTGTYIYTKKKKILIRATYYYNIIYKAIVECVEVAVFLLGENVRVRY